jgi:hypothetical protein
MAGNDWALAGFTYLNWKPKCLESRANGIFSPTEVLRAQLALLRILMSMRSDGVRNAGGGITRYAVGDAVDKVDLLEEVRQMAELFRPLNDIQLISQSRSRDKYSDFSDDERAAHKRVHDALHRLGEITRDELGGARDYVLKFTSGFHPASGIRGGKPKDLWFGIFRQENEQRFLGNPQIFMIVSSRGIEYGFSPLTHPDDFSNQEIRKRTREIARSVLEQLPAPGSPEAEDLAAQLLKSGNWHYRRKQRDGAYCRRRPADQSA